MVWLIGRAKYSHFGKFSGGALVSLQNRFGDPPIARCDRWKERGSLRVACALVELLHGALQVSPIPTKCSVRFMHPESTMVARSAPTASFRSQWVVIASCALLLVLLVGTFNTFQIQDGPAHVNAALTLANLAKAQGASGGLATETPERA